MKKVKPSYRRQDVMGYEAPPKEFQSCQSHLADETLEAMKKDFEMSQSLKTPDMVRYMMSQHHEVNEHECHWLGTALGRAWVGRQ